MSDHPTRQLTTRLIEATFARKKLNKMELMPSSSFQNEQRCSALLHMETAHLADQDIHRTLTNVAAVCFGHIEIYIVDLMYFNTQLLTLTV